MELVITYSGKSGKGAHQIAVELEKLGVNTKLKRGSGGHVNWGRANARTVLNEDISNVTNKRVMRQLFDEQAVPAPKLVDKSLVYGLFAPQNGFYVIGRPDQHMKGRGFWRCRNQADVRRALRGTRRKKAATHFMEYIDAPREYRVHIFKDKSIRLSEKYHTEFHEWTSLRPQHEVSHVREAAKKAVKAVGLDFGCVDVLADDERAWVTEVNSAPGIGGSTGRQYAKHIKKWFDENTD